MKFQLRIQPICKIFHFFQFFVVSCYLLFIQACELHFQSLNYNPDYINQKPNSVLLALVFTNNWNLFAFIVPLLFFVNKTKRKMLLYRWLGRWILWVKEFCRKPKISSKVIVLKN